MYKSSAVKIVSGKLVSAPLLSTSTILPSSLFLIGGIVVWRLWKRQGQLNTQTSELGDEVQKLKKQVTKIKAASSDSKKPTVNIPPSFKKFFNRDDDGDSKKPIVSIPPALKKFFNR